MCDACNPRMHQWQKGDPSSTLPTFSVQLGNPLGPPCPPLGPRYPGGGTPRGTPPSTRAPAARGDKVVRFRHHRASEAETQTWACRSQRPQGGAANLAATLRGRTASIRRGSRTMQSFGSGRLDNFLHLPHNAHTRTCRTCTCTCGWGVVVVAVVAGGETQEEGERCVLCFRIEPAARRPLAGDMSAVCPRFQDLGLLGAAGGCWGGRGFHSMVLEESKAQRGERGGNSSGGQEANLGELSLACVCALCVRERGCVCVCLCYCMTSLCTTLLLVEVPRHNSF